MKSPSLMATPCRGWTSFWIGWEGPGTSQRWTSQRVIGRYPFQKVPNPKLLFPPLVATGSTGPFPSASMGHPPRSSVWWTSSYGPTKHMLRPTPTGEKGGSRTLRAETDDEDPGTSILGVRRGIIAASSLILLLSRLPDRSDQEGAAGEGTVVISFGGGLPKDQGSSHIRACPPSPRF